MVLFNCSALDSASTFPIVVHNVQAQRTILDAKEEPPNHTGHIGRHLSNFVSEVALPFELLAERAEIRRGLTKLKTKEQVRDY